MLHTRIKSYPVSIAVWTFADIIDNKSVNFCENINISGNLETENINNDKQLKQSFVQRDLKKEKTKMVQKRKPNHFF